MTTACNLGRAAPRLRVLVDCDGVLADFVGLCLDYAARQYGLTYQRAAIDQWDCLAAMGLEPSEWGRFSASVGPLELCRRMATLPGAAAFLVALEAEYGPDNVKIATTPMNAQWLTQRAEWLEEHFAIPVARQIHIHDKDDLTRHYIAPGPRGWDILIDDKVENCAAFQDAGGLAFCIAAPYNTHCPEEIARGNHAECLTWVAAVTELE